MEKTNSLKLSFLNRAVLLNRHAAVGTVSLLTIMVFLPTFSNDFQLAWDDTWQVLENPLILQPSLETISFQFTHFWQRQYSPVNSLLYLIIHQLFGTNASAFHSVCLLIHLINSILVFRISSLVIARFYPTLDRSRIDFYAILSGLLFSIHPLQVESVAWISASKIILYGFFTLLAIWSYLQYIQSNKSAWLILVISAYVLGFGSKEQTIILPLTLFLIDLAWNRFSWKNRGNLVSSRAFLKKLPFLFLALAFLYFTWVNTPGGIQQNAGYPIYHRLIFAFHSLVEYVFRFLAPAKLYFFHPYPMSPGEALPLYYWGYILLAGIIGYIVWEQYQNGNSIVLFGFLFFLVNLILVLHIIPLPRPVITADRYMYLSVIGLAWVLVGLMQHWTTSTLSQNRNGLLLVSFVWLIFLGVQSHLRTIEWKDSESTKSNVIELLDKRREAESIDPLFNLIGHE